MKIEKDYVNKKYNKEIKYANKRELLLKLKEILLKDFLVELDIYHILNYYENGILLEKQEINYKEAFQTEILYYDNDKELLFLLNNLLYINFSYEININKILKLLKKNKKEVKYGKT